MICVWCQTFQRLSGLRLEAGLFLQDLDTYLGYMLVINETRGVRMVDEARKVEMREYQRERSAIRRARGLVTRTFWIWEEDSDAFRSAVSPYVDRARLIEALLGTAPLPALELINIIKRHEFPYDPEDIVFLADMRTRLALRPEESASAIEQAREILARSDLPIRLEDLIS